ncbi:hypothetical protein ACFL13_02865 [Patescibacteria group bacterium]
MFSILEDVITSSGAEPATRFGKISDFLGFAINLVLGVGISICIVAALYSAILHTMSAGDPDKAKKAWNAFLFAAIAGIIVIVTFAFKTIVIDAMGVLEPNITNDLPNY